MKNLEHIGNSFKVIARDPQILLDFHRGCQRFPESLKDPQGKGRKKKKQQYIYIYRPRPSIKTNGATESKQPKIEFRMNTPKTVHLISQEL